MSDADMASRGTKMIPREDGPRTNALLARIRAMDAHYEPVVMRVYLDGKSRPGLARPTPRTYVVVPLEVDHVARSVLVPAEGAPGAET